MLRYLAFICGLTVLFSTGCDFLRSIPTSAGGLSGGGAEGRPGEVVLMKFGATWCGPCRMIDEELDRLEPSMEAQGVRVERIDVGKRRDLADQYNVGSIPHLVLIHDGKVVGSQTGYRTEAQLQQWIKSYGLPSPGDVEANLVKQTGEVRTNPFAQQ